VNQHQHLSDYLRILYKRRWTVGLVFVLVFAYGALTSLRKVSIYEATTQLLIDQESRRATSLNSVLQDNPYWYDEDFYATQHRIMRSRALALKTLEELGMLTPPPEAELAAAAARRASGGLIERLAAMLGAPKQIEPPAADETTWQSGQIDAFLGGVVVQPVRNSRLVDIRYRSVDPVFATKAANALAEAYIDQGLSNRMASSQEANTYLTSQLKEQKAKLDASERALQDYKEKFGAVALTDAANNPVVRKLADMSAELTRAKTDRLARQQVFQALNEVKGDRARLEAFPAMMANEVVQRLRRDLADLRDQDTRLASQGLGEAYSGREQIAAAIKTKQVQLDAEINKVVQAIETEYQLAQARERSLQDQYDAQRGEAINQDRVAMQYLSLEADAKSDRQLYENLMQRAKETGVTGEFRGTNVQVVDAAEVPRMPVLPNRSRDFTFALMTGLLLAFGLAFGLEYLDSRLKTPDDIKTHLNVPFLGLVPAISTKSGPNGAPLLDRGVPPGFTEAMRALRTSVIFSSAADGSRTVMVTSTAPSEGKTLISSNLAHALAQAEQRTLIVDGDMRRPRVHEVFGYDQEPGLSNVLVGTTQLQSAIRRTDQAFLSVLPAGHLPPNPAELLGSPKYRRLLEQLGRDFDWIIVDAPPVMAVTDAAIISHDVGGVIFVVGAEMTPRRNAQMAIEQLTSARARIIGAVLNRVQLERHSYYYAPYHRKDYSRAYVRGQ
jgi:capsular exopolysaccharide synthesis family protein